jgi:FkbM family methyltransferase
MEIDFIFSRYINKKEIKFLDVGAHHGEFIDILKTHSFNHRIRLNCIEPLLSNVQRIRRRKFLNILNRNLSIHIAPIAITSETQVIDFFLGKADTLFTSKKDWMKKFPNEFETFKTIKVQGLDFNEYLNRFNLQNEFDVLKIDTEGADLEVLESIFNSTGTFSSIMIEISIDNYGQILQFLHNHGFDEVFSFLRIGVPTISIGSAESVEQFNQLRERYPGLCGNLVAFKRDQFQGDFDFQYGISLSEFNEKK